MKSARDRRTFTLLELIVVIVILGLLAALAVVGYRAVVDRSQLASFEARNISVAREVAAILAFQDGTTPEEALVEALEDLPPATAAIGIPVNGYNVGPAIPVEDRNDFGYGLAASGEFVFMSRFDDSTLVSCWVAPLGAAHGCVPTELAIDAGGAEAPAPSVPDIVDGAYGDIDLGFNTDGGSGSTTLPPETTEPPATTLPPTVLAGEALWAAGYDAGTSTSVSAVTVGPDGTVYVGGYFNGPVTFGSTNLVPQGTDGFVAALDPDTGAPVWAVGTGGVGSDGVNGLRVDGGVLYVAGHYSDTPSGFLADVDVDPSAGGTDAFVAALDPATGASLWATTAGGSGVDRAQAVDVAGGAVYVAGYYNGDPSGFLAAVAPSAGGNEAFVAALDPDTGAPVWAARAGGSGGDVAYALIVDGGTVFVAGQYSGTPDGFLASVGAAAGSQNDAFVAALNSASGAPLWTARAGGTPADNATALAVSDGTLYVAGSYNGTPDGFLTGVETAAPNGYSDAFVAALNSASGAPLWSARGGGASTDLVNGIVVDGGALYVAGSYNGTPDGFLTGVETSTGGTDVFVAALHPASGASLWATSAASTGSPAVVTVGAAAAADGTLYVGGSYQGTAAGFLSDAGAANAIDAFVVALT